MVRANFGEQVRDRAVFLEILLEGYESVKFSIYGPFVLIVRIS